MMSHPRLLLAIAMVAVLVPANAALAAPPECFGRRPTLVGTEGADRLVGTAGDDVIHGLGGSDVIQAGGGRDLICAGAGRDAVYGGPDSDRIGGGEGNDRLDGGDGADQIDGKNGDDVLLGRTGNDYLHGSWGADRLYGGGDRDRLNGHRGDDHVDGGPAYDEVIFATGHGGKRVWVDLASGDVVSADGQETVAQVEGADGTPYNDVIKGTAGPNRLGGSGGYDTVLGRAGNDDLSGDEVLGGDGNDMLLGREVLGHSGNDRMLWFIEGGEDPAIVRVTADGGPGDDSFHVEDECAPDNAYCVEPEIRLTGGDGTDRVRVDLGAHRYGDESDTEPYRFDLPAGRITNPSGLVVHVAGFEEVIGSRNNDTIIGTGRSELLMGGVGDDTIRGWGGHDVLAGGTRSYDDGADVIDAGTGDDTCFTSSPTGPPDTVERCETQRPVPVADPRFGPS